MTEQNENVVESQDPEVELENNAAESGDDGAQEAPAADQSSESPVVSDESPTVDAGENASNDVPAASADAAPVDSLFLDPEDSDGEVVAEPVTPGIDPAVVAALNVRIDALGAENAKLKSELSGAEAERDDAKNRLMRTAADLENFRKRAAREREDMRKYGIDKVVLDLLPVIDNLDRALEHAEKSEQSSSIVDGVRMVYRQFVSTLEKHGVTSFDARGEQFDPTRHEAIQQIETTEHASGTVIDQYQRGYFLHDRLIRAAMVSVAKKANNAEDVGQVEQESVEEPVDVQGAEPSEESAE